jgi:hypothetical protein
MEWEFISLTEAAKELMFYKRILWNANIKT